MYSIVRMLHNSIYSCILFTEDTNANEQRDREEELLQDLMKTVQERNRIEQRKMKTEAQ